MNESLLLFGIGINKFRVSNWQDKKPKLLELIDFENTKVLSCQSDYFKYQSRAPYLESFVTILAEDLDNLVNTFTEELQERYRGEGPVQNIETWELWAQRYTLGQYHGAHNHGMMNLSCVLYVEFDPKEHLPTTFYSPFPNPYYGTIHKAQPPVKEGEIIVFPSLLLHEAPVSPSDKRRTIMSFNIPLR